VQVGRREEERKDHDVFRMVGHERPRVIPRRARVLADSLAARIRAIGRAL
jgi:hypothetical protein